MKKQLLLFSALLIISYNGYSQILFEKGYYITNVDQKIDCFIKNVDWGNNPTNFDYKITENSESFNADINSVKEFGIYNNSKYIRKSIKIDKSSESTSDLNENRNPIFVEELLFLKVLVEGKGNLYYYEKGNLKRFFYNKDNGTIEQLVYKKYLILEDNNSDKIGQNNLFKQQLWNDLQCSAIDLSTIEKLEYTKNSLLNFFTEYNKCTNSVFVNHETKEKRDLFNLSLRAHLNNASLSIENSGETIPKTDFGAKLGLGIGVELEFILPYNKNKWAILIEPTYQNFKAENTADASNVSGGKQIVTADYSSIELPLSLRHYFFLNKNSKIFINASFIYAFSLKSSFEFKRDDGSSYNTLEGANASNYGLGLGYKFKDKYSMELRYQTSRNILNNYIFWEAKYTALSLIFGYSIF